MTAHTCTRCGSWLHPRVPVAELDAAYEAAYREEQARRGVQNIDSRPPPRPGLDLFEELHQAEMAMTCAMDGDTDGIDPWTLFKEARTRLRIVLACMEEDR